MEMSASAPDRGDLRWKTTGHVLRDGAQQHGDRLAVVDVDRTLRYADLAAEARAVTAALLRLGVQTGDAVSIWAPNCWRWVAFALGAQMAGAAIVPLNTRYKGLEAAYILGRTRPKVLLVEQGFLGNDYLGMLRSEWEGHVAPPVYILSGEDPGGEEGSLTWPEFVCEQADEADVDERFDRLDGSLLSDIMFTSGTTGRPKGVLTTHSQNLRAYYDWSRIVGFLPGDRYAIVNPFFHAFGYKAGWLSALMHGMTIYPHRTLEGTRLLDQVERERIQVLPGPPALYATLLAEPQLDQRDLSSLRVAVTGAASIPPVLIRRLFSVMQFERVSTCYGMTEGSAVATASRSDDDIETLCATSGRAVPDVEVAVVDDDGRAVPAGELGEVRIRGYNVMRGYLDAPEETARRVDPDGWLHTGDLGRMDERGNLAVVDRKGDMFIVGGFNAYPAEIESMLAEHPLVREVAVIGVPDGRLGEVGAAFVVPSPGGAPDPNEIIAWARAHMANFKVPRRVWVVEDLPRNATGKVVKGQLREWARSAAPEPTAARDQ
jgi:acyl-CoA synthetase (AMP-forming)/AMP-acid ligase II